MCVGSSLAQLLALIVLVYVCRFISSSAAVLVASDVAARGLDLPNVEHIIHYQVPRNTEV